MKQLFKDLIRGLVCGFGTLAGMSLFTKLSEDETKTKIKKKFSKIKDAIFKKDEEES